MSSTFIDPRQLELRRVQILRAVPSESSERAPEVFDRLLAKLALFQTTCESHSGTTPEIAQRVLWYAELEAKFPDVELISVWAMALQAFGLDLPPRLPGR